MFSGRLPVVYLLVLGGATSLALTASSEDVAPGGDIIPAVAAVTPAPINLPSATLGGTQFWSDELVYCDWRIQRNALTGHYRLLDDRDYRRAWGTFEQCQAEFARLRKELSLPKLSGRAVITLHGLGRSRDSMNLLGTRLAAGDITWINVSYASSRRSLDEHAASLARVLEGLEGIERIDFVCHSLGNLVVRRYLGEASQDEPRWQTDPRIKRMVMIGPPNNGAQLARIFKDNQFFGLVTGPSGKQLAASWEETEGSLAIPEFEFGIIAGGTGLANGANPIVPGDDDLVVGIEETKLPGAHDFLIVPSLHGRMLRSEAVATHVDRFLRNGHFRSAAEREPLPANAAAE
jgi:pimeloyl-ACP methyl ester carboxylesterase